MGRVKSVTIHDRVNNFKGDKLYASGSKVLMCGYCNCRLDWEKVDTLHKHIKTAGHINKKDVAKKAEEAGLVHKRQATLQDMNEKMKKSKTEKTSFIKDTVMLCLKANIPLEKLDHPAVREYLNKYIPGSGDLPKADTLRGTHLKSCGEQIREEVGQNFKDKPIVIVVDETTDCKGRCVFAIIFRTVTPTASQEVQLAACTFLDRADSSSCAQAIMDCLNSYNIKWENIYGLVSDSAPYMGACFRALNIIAGDRLLHFQCWAHKVNLSGDIFMKELKELNLFVTKTKMAFLNARKMKNAYIYFLKENYPDMKAKLFPSPVITRWNTWFHAVEYLAEYKDALIHFMKEYEPKNSSIDYILEQFADSSKATLLCVNLTFVEEVCGQFVKLINVLEGSKYPYAHLLWDDLVSLSLTLKKLSDGVFPAKTLKVVQEVRNLVVLTQIKTQIIECCQKSAVKLASHMLNRQDNSTNLFLENAGKLFNPAIVGQNVQRSDPILLASKSRLSPTFKSVGDSTFLEGYRYFQRQLVEQVRDGVTVDLIQLLLAVKIVHEEFAEAALMTVWAPVNSVDAERFFSRYNLVLTDRRTNMTHSTVETCAMLSFNQ